VAELVRMQPRETGRRAPSRNHLEQPRGRHRTGAAEPEVRQVGEGVAGAHAQVAVEGKGGLATKGDRSGPAALAEDDDHLVVQVEIAGEHDPSRLRDPHAGIEEQPEDRRVPPVGEVAALAGFQQSAQLVVG
jgi:hypothetical protein